MAGEAESQGATPTIEELQRKVIELQDKLRDTSHEAKEHRLARNQFRKRVEELEAATPADASKELEGLRKENRQLKHRTAFERVARDAGARTSGKALDTLWAAIAYDADGEADPAAIAAKVEAAKADYDFLFATPAAEGEKPPDRPAAELNQLLGGKTKSETAAKPPGPGGTGRGGPADGAGSVRVRKSDLQSFDPAINPMMDRNRARQIEQAKKDGKLIYLDE